ncbi:argonaute-like protein [Mycena belliarum]|uniref:Argonaute-like protein n=1 Tax=Mycena belliarum TaxID=1033014 RepID=A0AAD6XN24_9AGAR|nr:argonaute-like protein [Mycena belliae]
MSSTAVSVKTNSFAITRLPTKEYYQYDAGFVPDLLVPAKRQRAMHMLQVSIAPAVFHPRGVYDGKSLLYVSHRLNLPGGARFPVRLGNDPNAPVGSPGVVEIIVSKTASEIIRPSDLEKLIQDGATIDHKTAPATNLLQLLIRQSHNLNNPTNNGRAFFFPTGKKILPGTGVELWRGFFQSVRPTIGRMLINIDTSMAAVYEAGRLIDLAMDILAFNNMAELYKLGRDHPNFRKLENHFKNRLIKTKITRERTKTIYALVPGPIAQYSFQKEGVTTTIGFHLDKAHNIKLKYPGAFGVRISGKNAPFPVIVPAELCILLPGQLYKKRIPSSATSLAVDFATMAPKARLQTIAGGTTAGVQSPIQGYAQSEFIVDAGMEIDLNPMVLSARLLSHPDMLFAGTQSLKLPNGSWNVMRQTFRTPKHMKIWGVVNLDSFRIPPPLINRTIHDLMECCQQLGMSVEHPSFVDTFDSYSPEAALDTAHGTLIQRGPVDIIIILLPSKADEIRTRVKFWGDVTHGVRTSCLREDKLQRANNQYFNMVAIKLNARLGGNYAIPRSIELERLKNDSPFMILGADVTHPGPGVLRPSIASLVFSFDREAARYVAYTDVQPPRQEIIQQLQGMVKAAIEQFGIINPPPKRLIFFRDGVSEGELDTVKTAEVSAIKAACEELWREKHLNPKTLPTVTFIVVVKRHHAIFIPNDAKIDDGKTGNCRAGLVVDALRSPFARDFYLQSHGAIKGTSRSGHYSILLDENFNDDISRVQRLSFELCHLYAKCTRSISIPAPVYYADLVCARAKFHIDPSNDIDFDASTNASGSEEFDLQWWRNAYKPASGAMNYNKSMYFL